MSNTFISGGIHVWYDFGAARQQRPDLFDRPPYSVFFCQNPGNLTAVIFRVFGNPQRDRAEHTVWMPPD